MLRDGKFIRDENLIKATPYHTGKVRIGELYTPPLYRKVLSPEDQFAQNLILGIRQEQQSFFSRIFGLILKL
jgi:hypothetical protein